MPVPFRDADEFEELGAAGFLKIEQGSSASEFLAALFLVSARGEPLEFAYNRIETPNTVLWRPSDLRRYVERKPSGCCRADRTIASSPTSTCPTSTGSSW